MHQTTLKGIFPERKIPHRKNFIKENVKKIRQIQDTIKSDVTDTGVNHDQKPPKSRGNLQLMTHEKSIVNVSNHKNSNVSKHVVEKLDLHSKQKNSQTKIKKAENKKEKPTHRSTQTELEENVESIYSTGIIKYPSPSILVTVTKNKKAAQKKVEMGNGDSPVRKDAAQKHQSKDENKIDYVKQNAAVIKPKIRREKSVDNNGQAPSNYKRGVVPKYIKNKKDVLVEDAGDIECPPGHVLLPDEERRETLRVLRESYADKVQEMNSMPVRSDTLRMQTRKIELEKDLKKIDEGIKVFQRPKVFVKVNV